MREPRTTGRAGTLVSWALATLVALVMILGGIGHLMQPAYFATLVPPWLPAGLVLPATGVLQIAIGLAALWPATRSRAGLAFAFICLAYMPLHLWDFVRPDPVFPPPGAALTRVVVQILFIAAGLALWQRRHSRPAAAPSH
ncbi:hypothetical protein DBR42_11495 [Pelomonas sp. HMWF004]|nr:hypothetical protein DBR42_11495 [Pelomonas sp. HMWF004]